VYLKLADAHIDIKSWNQPFSLAEKVDFLNYHFIANSSLLELNRLLISAVGSKVLFCAIKRLVPKL